MFVNIDVKSQRSNLCFGGYFTSADSENDYKASLILTPSKF